MPSQVEVRLVWPVRPNVEPFTTTLSYQQSNFDIQLDFPVLYQVAPEVLLNGYSWSNLSIRWEHNFSAERQSFAEWAADSANASRLVESAEQVQNRLIDFAKSSPVSPDDLSCVKHFGPIDWPMYSVSVEGVVVYTKLGASAWTQFRSQQSTFISSGATIEQIEFSKRTLRRAGDLALSGYTTEAALLAVAVLDNAVQKHLIRTMIGRGIKRESADSLLRNVTTKRIATYLDPVLKLICQHSLAEEDKQLFKRILKINQRRNDAIHNGAEVSRKDAIEAIEACEAALLYLDGVEKSAAPIANLTIGSILETI